MRKENLAQPTRLEATVHGEVQRAGYRYLVQDMARKFNVKGYVQNMPDGTVKIVAEAPKKTIEKFVKTIRIKEPPINVERTEIKYSKPTGEFKFFAIKYGDLNEEMGEGFGTGLKYMGLLRAEIKLLRAETKQGFEDVRTEISTGFHSLRTETRKDFQNLSSQISTGFDTTKNEIKECDKT